MQHINISISNQIWVIKIIAVFTIFFAHMPLSDTTIALSENYSWLTRIFSLLGMVGVPSFFIISGYLFKPGNITRRARNLLIPLIIWGIITYLLHCINDGIASFGIDKLILWILGSNCYLYFVPILFCMILLYNIYTNDWVWIILGMIFIGLYQYHIIKYSLIFTPYMNPLNFIPYFAIGHLIRKHNLWEKLQSNSYLIISLAIVFGLFLLNDFYIHVWYFDLISLLINISFAIILINITRRITTLPENIIRLGKCTFVIYLCHMPIATTLNKILPHIMSGILEPIKILIAFSIVSVFVYFGYIFLNKHHWYSIMSYLGYRK